MAGSPMPTALQRARNRAPLAPWPTARDHAATAAFPPAAAGRGLLRRSTVISASIPNGSTRATGPPRLGRKRGSKVKSNLALQLPPDLRPQHREQRNRGAGSRSAAGFPRRSPVVGSEARRALAPVALSIGLRRLRLDARARDAWVVNLLRADLHALAFNSNRRWW